MIGYVDKNGGKGVQLLHIDKEQCLNMLSLLLKNFG